MRTFKSKVRRDGRLNLDHVWFADTPEECERVLRALKDSPVTGFDCEFGGYDIGNEHPVGKVKGYSMQFSTPELPYIFVQCWGSGRKNPQVFKEWFEDEDAKKVLHNYKADAHCVAEWGYDLKGLAGDTLGMDTLLNSARPHGLKACYKDYFGEETADFRETFKRPVINKNGSPGKRLYLPSVGEMLGLDGVRVTSGNEETPLMYQVGDRAKFYVPSEDVLIDYAVKDPYYTLRLFDYLKEKLQDVEWCSRGSMWDYYETFDLPYTRVLYKMERRGVPINGEYLKDCDESMMKDIVELERTFMKESVKLGADPEKMLDFNMNAPQQVGGLFAGFGMKFTDLTEKTKLPKVTPEQLNKNKTKKTKAIIEAYLEFKALDKLHGTYALPLREMGEFYGGRAHTEYRQYSTATSRLASANLNLQNIPANKDQDKYRLRKAFQAEPGKIMADSDLAQIEMRLMAHLTNDKAMIKAINAGHDLHAVTAADCFKEVMEWVEGQRAAGVSDDVLFGEGGPVKANFGTQRNRSKNLNFGIAYGMTEIRYAAMTGANKSEALRVMGAFFAGKPELTKGIKQAHNYCHRYGYVKTLLQRRLYVPDINSPIFWKRKAAERQSFNYTVQSSAGELLKMAMLLIDDCPTLEDLEVTMHLQIHDELLFQMPDTKATKKAAKPLIEDYMSRPYAHFGMKDLQVPTPAELNFGYDWASAK